MTPFQKVAGTLPQSGVTGGTAEFRAIAQRMMTKPARETGVHYVCIENTTP